MPEYKVQFNYVSSLAGPWAKGDVVQVDCETADALERDCPGVLRSYVRRPKQNRQVTRAKVRGKD